MKTTDKDIAAVLAFRRGFERPWRQFYREATVDAVGASYGYDDDVVAFFEIAAGPAWSTRYSPKLETARLRDPAYIARADLPALRRLITACVRGERYCDGWWAQLLRDGVVQRVLKRLETMVDRG